MSFKELYEEKIYINSLNQNQNSINSVTKKVKNEIMESKNILPITAEMKRNEEKIIYYKDRIFNLNSNFYALS